MGLGQMERRLQSQVDFRPGYPQRKSQAHKTQVSLVGLALFDSDFTVYICISSNTQERKPVTNSRDTQELLPDAGQEMLRIFHTHPARTSLLQDFAFYEVR